MARRCHYSVFMLARCWVPTTRGGRMGFCDCLRACVGRCAAAAFGDAVVCSRLQAPALHGSACENVCVYACTIWGRLGDGVGVVSCTFGEIAGQKSRQHKQQQRQRRTVRTFAPVAGTNMHATFGPAANTIVGKNANKSFGHAEFNCSVRPRRCRTTRRPINAASSF